MYVMNEWLLSYWSMLAAVKLGLRGNSSLHALCPATGCVFLLQAFYVSIVDLCENGGKRPTPNSSAGFTKEQADTIRRIRNSKDSWDMLGVKPGASR